MQTENNKTPKRYKRSKMVKKYIYHHDTSWYGRYQRCINTLFINLNYVGDAKIIELEE